jgi:hypothetical protein
MEIIDDTGQIKFPVVRIFDPSNLSFVGSERQIAHFSGNLLNPDRHTLNFFQRSARILRIRYMKTLVKAGIIPVG